jgi:secondary thiamine-phosphate synthase enzyme
MVLLQTNELSGTMYTYHATLLYTPPREKFADVTDDIYRIVSDSGVVNGTVTLYTPHTTTAILINEHEERLLSDLERTLERIAPQTMHYLHDDLQYRDCPPDEPLNGHAHCKALFLQPSQTIPIVDKGLLLGRWQSIFYLELDSLERERNLEILVNGMK